jgi:hypothetical protein
MKGWHIGAAVLLAVLVLLFAPLVFANAPFTVVCDAGRSPGRVNILGLLESFFSLIFIWF